MESLIGKFIPVIDSPTNKIIKIRYEGFNTVDMYDKYLDITHIFKFIKTKEGYCWLYQGQYKGEFK